VLPRRAQSVVEEALADTRVVIVNGARQAGKSTLVRVIAGNSARWRNLDRDAERAAAMADPASFVAGDGLLIVDEIQRVPELLLAIKEKVDLDTRPGQFLLTGSARVLGLRALPDALPGRTETVELWPLSQGEIDGLPDGFVDAAFRHGADISFRSDLDRRDYIERVTRGGFPEAVARPQARRRERFLDSYVADLISRDVSQLSEIERADEMLTLLTLVAARSGQLLVENTLANDTRLSARTVGRYLDLLEHVFLIKRIPAWPRNISARSVGTPKVCVVDSGLAANLVDVDADGLMRYDAPVGHLLESFVLMELARQLTWSRHRARLYHYRTRDGVEVDAVLEDRRGRVVAVEVKAAATVRSEDFRGLRHLADRLGDDLLAGIVLYTGRDTLPFGPRLRAVPLSALWHLAGD
jgi:hypothetical protein